MSVDHLQDSARRLFGKGNPTPAMPTYYTGQSVTSKTLTKLQVTTFAELVAYLKANPAFIPFTREEFQAMSPAKRNEAKQVSYLTACTFPSSPWRNGRRKEHAQNCDLIFLDIDSSEDARPFVENPSLLPERLGEFNFLAWKTASCTKEAPRLRVMVDADCISPPQYHEAVETLGGILGLSEITGESFNEVQPMYVPCVFKGTEEQCFIAENLTGKSATMGDIHFSRPLPPVADAPQETASSDDVLRYLENHQAPIKGFTLEHAKEALGFIDPSCRRVQWIRIICALKHQFAEQQDTEAFEVFHEWSEKGGNYAGREDCETSWQTLKIEAPQRRSVTAASLIAMAQEGGWKNTAFTPQAEAGSPSAAKPSSKLPPIQNAAELIAQESKKPPPTQLVEGLLHIGEKLMLAGASKSYKSWALLDLACSVGGGIPFWGNPTTKGRVLLINYEIRDFFYADRIKRVTEAKQCPPPDNVDVWNLRGKRADFDRVLTELKTMLSEQPYALIVIDPLYAGLGGRSENDAAEMALLMNRIEELAELGPAVALGHHFAKGNSAMRDSIDRASGSGVFARDPDSIVTLTRHQTDSAFVAEFTLRNFPQLAPKGLKLEFPLLRPDATLDVSKLRGAQVKSRVSVTPEMIASLLPPDGLKTTAFAKIAKEETGCSSSRFYALLDEGKKIGFIKNEGGINTKTTPPEALPEYSKK
jgi:hypothetical protein